MDLVVIGNLSVLRRGSKGDQVKLLQSLLNRSMKINPAFRMGGDFGPRTERAVEAFQTAAELRSTGIVDAATWRALFLAIPNASGGLQAKIVPIALRYLGASERKGNYAGNDPRMKEIFEADELVVRRRINKGKSGARGIGGKLKRATTRRRFVYQTDGYPWCAAFVSLCVQKLILSDSRYAGIVPPREPSVRKFLKHWAPSQSCVIFRPSSKLYSPGIGDIVVFKFSHIGIVTKVLEGAVMTIEGNTNLAGSREGTSVLLKYRSLSRIRRFIRLPTMAIETNLLSGQTVV